ncbi:MAG: glycosyltransferase family 4 protein [Desulfobaccales bacterium]
MKKPRVLLLHSDVSPYRLPLFDSLGKEIELTVYFCDYKPSRRKWIVPEGDYSFRSEILRCLNVGPFMINPTLIKALISNTFDIYILGADSRIIVSLITAFAFAKFLKKPLIIWSGSTENNYFEAYKRLADRYVLSPIYSFIHRYSDAFIAYGEATREYLLNRQAAPEKIVSGTQALQSEQVFARDSSVKPPNRQFEGKKVILCISYFDRRKGIDYLIEAYKMLKRDDTVLIIGGSGVHEGFLKTLASGREDILFTGYLHQDERAYYYSTADIFAFPTLSDGWGLVVNEAMMFGLPVVVTSEAGCARELIKGNGFVVRPGSAVEIKQALESLLDDEELRKRMGIKSKEIIGHFTIENAKDVFLRAIRTVLAPLKPDDAIPSFPITTDEEPLEGVSLKARQST